MRTISRFIITLSTLLIFVSFSSCSGNDSDSPDQISSTLQQYKWVCENSDDPLIDDDYEWAIFDDYETTLYFVSDNMCVIRYYNDHYDTDDGHTYDTDVQTTKYEIRDGMIYLEESRNTPTTIKFEGSRLIASGRSYYEGASFDVEMTFEKETITSDERSWLNNIVDQTPSQDELDKYADLQNVVKENISCQCQYNNFTFNFTITSSLKSKYPSASIKYGVGHTTIDYKSGDKIEVTFGDENYNYSISSYGDTQTIKFKVPFWYYYYFTSATYDAGFELYYDSYIALSEKSSLTAGEQELYDDIVDEFNYYQKDARNKYRPRLAVAVDSKTVLLDSYKIP